MSVPRPLFAAIGATQESAREQILAVGPDSLEALAPNIGDVLTWNGTAWVPEPGGAGPNRYFVFTPGALQSGNVYGDWAALFAAIAVLPLGEKPIVTFTNAGVPFIVPSVGMPVTGWDMRGGYWESYLPTTGAVVVSIPNGVMVDNLLGIREGLQVKINPALGTSVLNFSLFLAGQVWVFSIDGAIVDHSTNTGALIQSPGGVSTTTVVIALTNTTQKALGPALSGPVVLLTGNDHAVGVQQTSAGGIPNGWLAGGGLTSTVLIISDVEGNDPTNPAFMPGFTGGGGVTRLNFSRALMLTYNDSLVSPPLNATDVQHAIDALKALMVGGGGSTAIWRGTGAPTAPGIFNTWAALFAWANAAPGSKHIYLDSSFGSLQVPSGLWTFVPPVEFIGSPVDPRTILTLNEASFRNVWRWSRIKFIELNVLTVPFGNFPETMEFNDCDLDMSGGAQPFIRTVTSAMDVTFRHMAVYPTTQLVFDMQPTAPPCTVRLFDGTTVALNSFSSAIGTTLTLVQDASSTYLPQFFVFGTLIRQLENSAYIPGNAANWTFPPPTTVFEALDRLAAKFVASALGTP